MDFFDFFGFLIDVFIASFCCFIFSFSVFPFILCFVFGGFILASIGLGEFSPKQTRRLCWRMSDPNFYEF